MKMLRNLMIAMVAGMATMAATPSMAQKEVTIAYQDMLDPYRIMQDSKALEKATGYKINWKQFGGGGEVIKALASGAVQVGEVGSAGISAAVSRGEPLELFWILENIADAEALVVRKGSGIKTVADLKGKKVATPFNSTTHFDLMVALEHAHINPGDVKILNLRPQEIEAAWKRGDIDATFIWNPVLSEVKKDGEVITSSGKIAMETGKATFDGYVVNKDWAKSHHDFMVKFVKIMAKADEEYRNNKSKWTASSPQVKAVAKWSGAKAEDVPASMALYEFPTMHEQATKWLGGGKDGLATKALTATAEFQKSQKQIDKTLPDYSVAVTPVYVQDAMK